MKFTPLDPADVRVGRGRIAWITREPYRQHLRDAEAGRVELERGDQIGTVKRLLADSARELGIRIRSSAERDGRALVWKRTGSTSSKVQSIRRSA